jgi:hypothetical protein
MLSEILSTMAVNVQKTFEKGGKKLIDLLDYCVRSMEMAPLFLFLVQEYRRAPTAAKAVALFEIFCRANAPSTIDVPAAIPPINLQIQTDLRPFISAPQGSHASEPMPSVWSQRVLLPPKYLFDSLAAAVLKDSVSFRRVSRRYQPSRSPLENLPGGKMTMSQRHFVEKVWEPVLRPQLMSAGFWRMSTIA